MSQDYSQDTLTEEMIHQEIDNYMDFYDDYYDDPEQALLEEDVNQFVRENLSDNNNDNIITLSFAFQAFYIEIAKYAGTFGEVIIDDPNFNQQLKDIRTDYQRLTLLYMRNNSTFSRLDILKLIEKIKTLINSFQSISDEKISDRKAAFDLLKRLEYVIKLTDKVMNKEIIKI